MTQTADQMELAEAAIRRHYPAAEALLTGFDHAPRLGKARAGTTPERSAGIGTRPRFRSTTPGLVTRATVRAGGVHLSQTVLAADEGDALPSPLQATLLQALRRALAIAMATGEELSGLTGAAALKKDNLEGRLAAARQAEFTEILAAESAAQLYTFANVLAFLLAPSAPETTAEVGQIDEILLDNPPLALQGALWELDQILGVSASDTQTAALTLAWAEAVLEKLGARASALPRTSAFEAARWRVEADDLPIAGFTPSRKARSTTLVMQFKKPEEVIGNHIAKYQAMKLSKMIMAYDFTRKLNPFVEAGGFIFTFMGDGAPGTGKTTLIQMMAGMISGYCEVAGYPFRCQNFSIDQIDSYQGKSGQNAKAFVQNVLDPSVIGFGTIDDIDQIAGKRGDRQSSAGQQEVTAVFMEAFAGANTVVRGNCTFGMFSNFPQNVDDALRQRAGARFLVDGPQSREDYIDILTLLLGKKHDIPLGEHDLYAAQALHKAVSASFASHARPQEAALAEVWDRAERELGRLDTLAKVGSYLKRIQEADPRFTGRAIKNITDAVKVRAMDFELPDAWMENPDLFLRKPYDDKLAMLRSMASPITIDMVLQEINRYADSEFRYADKSDEVAIQNAVQEMERLEEARRGYAALRGQAGAV